MGWDRPILTDSEGYQVYGLAENRKIEEEGVTFGATSMAVPPVYSGARGRYPARHRGGHHHGV